MSLCLCMNQHGYHPNKKYKRVHLRNWHRSQYQHLYNEVGEKLWNFVCPLFTWVFRIMQNRAKVRQKMCTTKTRKKNRLHSSIQNII